VTERIFRCREIANARQAFVFAWSAAKLFTEPFEIVLRPLKPSGRRIRTDAMWALLREVAATVWIDGRQFSDEVWHEHFKRQFIGQEEIVLPSGAKEVRGISTTTLNVADMGRYMDEISQWCVEQGFPLEEAA